MSNKHTITRTTRNGKVALWVDVAGSPHNIWDLPKEIAEHPDVLAAICHAFELGLIARSAEVYTCLRAVCDTATLK